VKKSGIFAPFLHSIRSKCGYLGSETCRLDGGLHHRPLMGFGLFTLMRCDCALPLDVRNQSFVLSPSRQEHLMGGIHLGRCDRGRGNVRLGATVIVRFI